MALLSVVSSSDSFPLISDPLYSKPLISEFSIITNELEFNNLKDDWDELWLRASNAELFQTFAYCWHSWQQIAKPAKRELYCLVARQGCTLTFVWPLVRYRQFWLSILRPLGPGAAEYSHPLLASDTYATLYCSLAWQLIHNSNIDIINIPFLRGGSPLDQIIAGASPVHADYDVSAVVEWQNYKDWESYYSSLSKNYSKSHSKNWRQIHRTKAVTFEIVEDKQRFTGIIDWLLEQKRQWAAETKGHKTGKWLLSDDYRQFLLCLAIDQDAIEPLIIYVLKIDDQIAAVKLAALNGKRTDWIIAAYDRTFAKLSPGMVLSEYCMRLAFSDRLKIDFGVGKEEGKLFWSHANLCRIVTYRFANSTWGYVGLKLWRVVVWGKDLFYRLLQRK